MKSKHLVCLSFLWRQVFFWGNERNYFTHNPGHSQHTYLCLFKNNCVCTSWITNTLTIKTVVAHLYLQRKGFFWMYTGNGHAPDKFILNEETMCILHNKSNWEALTKKLIKRNVITINSRHIYLISVVEFQTWWQKTFENIFLCFLEWNNGGATKIWTNFYYLFLSFLTWHTNDEIWLNNLQPSFFNILSNRHKINQYILKPKYSV